MAHLKTGRRPDRTGGHSPLTHPNDTWPAAVVFSALALPNPCRSPALASLAAASHPFLLRPPKSPLCCRAAKLAEQFRALDWGISLAHAGICSKMKQNPDKTDLNDAHLLADLVRVKEAIMTIDKMGAKRRAPGRSWMGAATTCWP